MIITLRLRQNGHRFADNTFKRIFLNENVRISIKISLKFVPMGPINNIPALVQIMAWRRSGDKTSSEPMMVSLLTHICVTPPQWVIPYGNNTALFCNTTALIQSWPWQCTSWWSFSKLINHLLKALKDLPPKLGQGILVSLRNVGWIYRNIPVIMIPVDGQFKLVLDIPVLNLNEEYRLYKADQIPILSDEKIISWNLNNVVRLSWGWALHDWYRKVVET